MIPLPGLCRSPPLLGEGCVPLLFTGQGFPVSYPSVSGQQAAVLCQG